MSMIMKRLTAAAQAAGAVELTRFNPQAAAAVGCCRYLLLVV
jgi:hypothetical protein